MAKRKPSKRTNLNFKQTHSSRSAGKSNVTFGHFQRMEPFIRRIK